MLQGIFHRRIKSHWWDKEVSDKIKKKKLLYSQYLQNKDDDSKKSI
jgi:hypothetical protein